MPSPPLKYTQTQITLDLSNLAQQINLDEAQRQQAFDLSRKIHVAVVQAQDRVGQADATTPLRAFLANDLLKQRLANLSLRVEDMIRLEAYQYFLQTGQLVPLSTVSPLYACTDDEYLAGACMGLAQDLQRYVLGRATVRDAESVVAATDLLTVIQDFLLQLDFRNGPLRRKFDATKYCLKACETILYELAVTSSTDALPNPKRIKSEDSTLIPHQELLQLKQRMEYRDELRESLIKTCRDGQKAAKQAIFALHRGDCDRASQLLQTTETVIAKLQSNEIQNDSSLRTSGSFVSVLEEYVEARLFAAWLHGLPDNASTSPAGVLLTPADFETTVNSLKPEEYLGGLCDLTGEVGRFAVQRGTARDTVAVQACWQTNAIICTSLESLERLPVGKKMEWVRRSVQKIERMLYELSLSEAAGGRNVQSNIEVDGPLKEETND